MTTTTRQLTVTINDADASELAELLAANARNWDHIDAITEYTACLYGRDGDAPGQVQIVLEGTTVAGIMLYRWAENDDGGTHETGDATLYRDIAEEAGREYAEQNDETPDAEDQIQTILDAGWFGAAVDADTVRKLIDYIESYSDLGQGHVIIDRDAWSKWVTRGYVEGEAVYVGVPHGGFGSWAGAADALLRAVTADDNDS